jgi:hypothetical protein
MTISSTFVDDFSPFEDALAGSAYRGQAPQAAPLPDQFARHILTFDAACLLEAERQRGQAMSLRFG